MTSSVWSEPKRETPAGGDRLEEQNLLDCVFIAMAFDLAMASDLLYLIRSKKLLGAPGIATRSKDATRGSFN